MTSPQQPPITPLAATVLAVTLLGVAAIGSYAVIGLIRIYGDSRPAGQHQAIWHQPPQSALPSPSPTATKCLYLRADQEAVRQVPSTPEFDPNVDGRSMIAKLTTNLGTIVLKLDGAAAPCTVASFRHLAENGFYNRSTCHRLTDVGLWVLQCGDPGGNGMGGPGYEYADENLPTSGPYRRGVVAMANSGPDTNGSQFFISYRDNSLDPDYSVFGEVISGLEIVDKVAAAGHDDRDDWGGGGKPKLRITIRSVTVAPA